MFNDWRLVCSVVLVGALVAISDCQVLFRAQPSFQSSALQRLAALLGQRFQGGQAAQQQGRGFVNNNFGFNNNNGFRGFGTLGTFGRGFNGGFARLNGGFGGAARQNANGYRNFKAVSSTYNSVKSDAGFGNSSKNQQYGQVGHRGGFGNQGGNGVFANAGNQQFGRQLSRAANVANQAAAGGQTGQFGSQGVGSGTSLNSQNIGFRGGQAAIG
ncbi:uncharacterized protein LOC106157668 [Lingula anatina]|uniref:Uncharacterized protein LOC106157668 n=1 Tax=Lingula anatina TaxID=7574 RepID=A0A1S3HTG1_LINAN|nr:uncharacterized protein LOC106157668 [Lingula anatina]|eukprot:XP_013388836.1 uncharacterized protein LOC106157668 [Lingula anatina]